MADTAWVGITRPARTFVLYRHRRDRHRRAADSSLRDCAAATGSARRMRGGSADVGNRCVLQPSAPAASTRQRPNRVRCAANPTATHTVFRLEADSIFVFVSVRSRHAVPIRGFTWAWRAGRTTGYPKRPPSRPAACKGVVHRSPSRDGRKQQHMKKGNKFVFIKNDLPVDPDQSQAKPTVVAKRSEGSQMTNVYQPWLDISIDRQESNEDVDFAAKTNVINCRLTIGISGTHRTGASERHVGSLRTLIQPGGIVVPVKRWVRRSVSMSPARMSATTFRSDGATVHRASGIPAAWCPGKLCVVRYGSRISARTARRAAMAHPSRIAGRARRCSVSRAAAGRPGRGRSRPQQALQKLPPNRRGNQALV